MFDLNVTSSVAVFEGFFEAAIWVKSTHLIKSCLETEKKTKYRNRLKEIYT